MLTIHRAAGIAGILFTTVVLAIPTHVGALEEHDERAREPRENREPRELEARQRAGDLHEAIRRREVDEAELGHRELAAELDRLLAEIQELRAREIDLRAMMERMELDGRPGEAHQARQELVHVTHEIERRQLEVERIQMERQRRIEERELVRMTERLRYVASWRDVAFDPHQAVMLATQAIVELHVGIGQPGAAVDMLSGVLERVEEVGSRTAIRFALKDVYLETDESGRAAEQMIQVILENARAIMGDEIVQPR